MKNLRILCFTLVSFLVATSAYAQLIPTNMMVTVIDGNGNVQVGATVKVYATEKDYDDDKNPVAVEKTNEKGIANFKKLETKSYFIRATKGELNNDDTSHQTGALAAKKINKVNIVVSGLSVPKMN